MEVGGHQGDCQDTVFETCVDSTHLSSSQPLKAELREVCCNVSIFNSNDKIQCFCLEGGLKNNFSCLSASFTEVKQLVFI